jgi:hypothetical protein
MTDCYETHAQTHLLVGIALSEVSNAQYHSVKGILRGLVPLGSKGSVHDDIVT